MLQLQTTIEEERCKVLQIDSRLQEILETSSYFVDRSQDVLEVLTARMARLEDQLRLSAAKIEAIKNQAAKFKINIQFLDPCAFEGIASEALAWNKFLNTQVGPSS